MTTKTNRLMSLLLAFAVMALLAIPTPAGIQAYAADSAVSQKIADLDEKIAASQEKIKENEAKKKEAQQNADTIQESGKFVGQHRTGGIAHSDGGSAGFQSGVDNTAFLNFGNAAGHADDHTGLGGKQRAFGNLPEQRLQHAHRHFMVRNNAILQRMHSHHITGGSAQHIPGGRAHLQNLVCVFIHSHHGGLPNHNALFIGADQHIGGAQIHAQIIGK